MPSENVPGTVSTDWLAAHREDPDLLIFDSSFKMPGVLPLPMDDYKKSHIEGSGFFSIEEISDKSSPLPHMLPEADLFEKALSELGISNQNHIVFYDQSGALGAARAWWMMRVFGHEKVSVLDGGLHKWKMERRPVDNSIPEIILGSFKAQMNKALLRSKSDLLSNLKNFKEQVVDARVRPRFTGDVPEPRAGLRQGHIPKSRNLDHAQLINASDKTFKSEQDLRKLFLEAGLDMDAPIIASCGSGVSACVLALGLFLLNKQDASVYDGSWAEWGMPSETPIETGAPST